MATMKTHISWTDSTWNPTTGCTKVSAGCDRCYAEALTNRLFGGGFDEVKTHPKRLAQVHGFQPIALDDGSLRPRMVFVNSMSDVFHEKIPDTFRHLIFDAMEAQPWTIFQLLSKRPIQTRKYLRERYGARGVPRHLHIGFSVEDNRVAARLNILRKMKDDLGEFTAIVSNEPVVAACDELDFAGVDQVFIGGESGPGARPYKLEWATQALEAAERAGAARWFKQWGQPRNNPAVTGIMRVEGLRITDAFQAAVKRGLEKLPDEKGGATVLGAIYREYPASFHTLKADLNAKFKGDRSKLAKADTAGGRLL